MSDKLDGARSIITSGTGSDLGYAEVYLPFKVLFLVICARYLVL